MRKCFFLFNFLENFEKGWYSFSICLVEFTSATSGFFLPCSSAAILLLVLAFNSLPSKIFCFLMIEETGSMLLLDNYLIVYRKLKLSTKSFYDESLYFIEGLSCQNCWSSSFLMIEKIVF